METLYPRLHIDPSAPVDPEALFGRAAPLWLEVGFGGGEHLVAQAKMNPNVNLIGVEPFLNGMAKAVTAIHDAGLANVRLLMGDARDLLEQLPDGCLGRVFVLFPDPWPKSRHHKRRIIQHETLDQFARLMPPGGDVRVASDIPGYVAWTLARIRRHGGFQWTAERPSDWRLRPEDWPPTRYEQKALKAGRVPSYLSFRRSS